MAAKEVIVGAEPWLVVELLAKVAAPPQPAIATQAQSRRSSSEEAALDAWNLREWSLWPEVCKFDSTRTLSG